MSAEGTNVPDSSSNERGVVRRLSIAAIAAWLFPWPGAAYKEAAVVSFVLFCLALLYKHFPQWKQRDTSVKRTSSGQDLDKHVDLEHLLRVKLGLASDVDDPLKLLFKRDSQDKLNKWFCELESASRIVSNQDVALLYHVARHSARCGRGLCLQRALDCMDHLRIQANLHIYTDIISRRGNSRDYEDAKRWYRRMQRAGLTGDDLVYSSLIHGAGKSGNLEEAESWFRAMIKKGLSPTVVTINSMINACSRAKHPELGERWLQVMDDLGLTPSVITYNTVISGFANAGQSERAEFWLAEMMRQGIGPDYVSYGAILHGLLKRVFFPSDPVRAMQAHRLMTQIIDRNLVGNRPAHTYKCVIGVCAVARQFELAEYWMDHAEASGVRLNASSYKFLERAYVNADMMDAAGRIRARKERGFGGECCDVATDT